MAERLLRARRSCHDAAHTRQSRGGNEVGSRHAGMVLCMACLRGLVRSFGLWSMARLLSSGARVDTLRQGVAAVEWSATPCVKVSQRECTMAARQPEVSEASQLQTESEANLAAA